MNKYKRPVWAEVDLNNLKHNLQLIKDNLKDDTMIMAVVKADAYGHGLIPVAKTLSEEKVERLGVAIPDEGVILREAGITIPVHVLGEVLPSQCDLLMDYNLIPTVARVDSLMKFNKLAAERGIRKVIHIKVDTGMSRIGVSPDTALDFIMKARQLDNIEVEGIMTHFATADEEDKEYSYLQWERFNYVLRELEKKGIDIPIKHAANSAAVLDLDSFQLNMTRPGIILYGLPPSSDVRTVNLKPVLSWKARIDFIKEVPAGTAISYGATYITERASKIAVVPLGYADGFSRSLSNKGYVLIRGQKAPIRGRVCMDQFIIDVTDISGIDIGEEIVLIGRQDETTITATDIAELTGTINYEVLCNISKRVPRIYIK